MVSPKGGEVVGKKPVFTQGVEAPQTGGRPSFFNTLLRADEHVEYRWVTPAELEDRNGRMEVIAYLAGILKLGMLSYVR